MIYIATAMYCEAEPFIKELNLKKDTSCHRFQIFKNEEVILIITGIGKLKSAVGVSYILSKYEPSSRDFFINVGVCGTHDKSIPIGELLLCNKIIDNENKRSFYPDMIFDNSFREASIETCSFVVREEKGFEGDIFDMEAYGVCEGSMVFMKTHQVAVFKIVSDYCNSNEVNSSIISKLIKDKLSNIMEYAMEIHNYISKTEEVLSEDERNTIERLSINLRLSATMENKLNQFFTYYKLQKGDFKDILEEYMETKSKSKNEGKRYFEELRERLI